MQKIHTKITRSQFEQKKTTQILVERRHLQPSPARHFPPAVEKWNRTKKMERRKKETFDSPSLDVTLKMFGLETT
jgi:hypothetical protein